MVYKGQLFHEVLLLILIDVVEFLRIVSTKIYVSTKLFYKKILNWLLLEKTKILASIFCFCYCNQFKAYFGQTSRQKNLIWASKARRCNLVFELFDEVIESMCNMLL